ncbi:MAG TPA: hypothetical protein VEK33_21665 [Terriglobales bacterium]|nr:hypothetical protein [Terriglobales bacterium]
MWPGRSGPKKRAAALLFFLIGFTGCGDGSTAKGDIGIVFIVLLSITSIFLLMDVNREVEEENFTKIMQFYSGIELENEVMRWILLHPKQKITVEGLGKELDRPPDRVRSAVERLGSVTNSVILQGRS